MDFGGPIPKPRQMTSSTKQITYYRVSKMYPGDLYSGRINIIDN